MRVISKNFSFVNYNYVSIKMVANYQAINKLLDALQLNLFLTPSQIVYRLNSVKCNLMNSNIKFTTILNIGALNCI